MGFLYYPRDERNRLIYHKNNPVWYSIAVLSWYFPSCFARL